jgi:hypothetical protein
MSPETCWGSYKYGIIQFWYIIASCWIFFINWTPSGTDRPLTLILLTWRIGWTPNNARK